VVILTRDPAHVGFWMTSDYLPQALELDRGRFPTLVELARGLGRAEVRRVPIPADCTDGLLRGLLAATGGVSRSRGAGRHLDL